MKNLKVGLTLAASLIFAASAFAGTDTANLGVSAVVTVNCTITANAVAFGSYDPIVANASSPLDQNGSVVVTCTNGSTGTITLDEGQNADGSSTPAAPVRRMSDGSNFLSYNLYTDAPLSTVWGNTALTGVDHLGDGSATGVTVYGRVPAGQNVPADTYNDTVVATVTF